MFALLGALAGIAEAALLRRSVSARVGGTALLGMVLRLALVGTVLLAAAVAGHLLSAALGWAGGFAGGVFLVAMRMR